jgi:hypothetical protein
VKEGARELGRGGKRGSMGRGARHLLSELREPRVGVARVVMIGVNGFNAIEDGERLTWVKEGP